MKYDELSLMSALKNLRDSEGWQYAFMISKYPKLLRMQNNTFFHVLAKTCGKVYTKAFDATGRQKIGTTADLWKKEILTEYGLVEKDLFDAGAEGNILRIDQWSLVVNDCWVLGGVHRKADFELVSPQSPQNLWDPNINGGSLRQLEGNYWGLPYLDIKV